MITEISGTITLADGSTSEFSIDASCGLEWTQWGVGIRTAWETAQALEAMTNGLESAGLEFGYADDEDDDEDE